MRKRFGGQQRKVIKHPCKFCFCFSKQRLTKRSSPASRCTYMWISHRREWQLIRKEGGHLLYFFKKWNEPNIKIKQRWFCNVVWYTIILFCFLHISYCVILFSSFFSTSSLVVIVGGSCFYIGGSRQCGRALFHLLLLF